MTERREPLERIADALERLAPPVTTPIDWLGAPAYVWSGTTVAAIGSLETVPLATLRGIDRQKKAVCTNFERLATGAAAHDMLLWGSRGMGKSALIRAASVWQGEEHPGALALVQVASDGLGSIAGLIDTLAKQDRAYLLFLDDLGFAQGKPHENLALRSLLDGTVVARPPNVRLAVTSNRRAIVQRGHEEDAARHERDERDDALALADRFGLTLGFHPCDQATYLEIVRAYTDPLALLFDEEEALAWAVARGNRSGRIAYQFANEVAGRAGKAL
ncbi:predicted ATPase [Erythrobacter sp. NAP1]|uniref:DUF815 domain-containing protein n=1 Tax=Erythrobacter sp. NAP1 TaxID=237727 RepID=UPI000068762E|nr:DUF815 domain-containing protein [Erythrobacter sp. NAP1]EAQ28505.1 predicted ATPase [Erythrobacter sp. NAP1]